MPRKIGRNAPCWCGSGIKFKKCHLNRKEAPPLTIWDADAEVKKIFSYKTCLAPSALKSECSGTIVKAHTVPKSSSLTKIAQNGHVYQFQISVTGLEKAHGQITPTLVGINKATTFTGFCSKHDDSIFSAIEKEPFKSTPQQCFLLAFRAFSREFYTKQAALKLQNLLKVADKGKTTHEQLSIQSFASDSAHGAALALSDAKFRNKQLESSLVTESFGEYTSLVIEFGSIQPLMCSGGFCPTSDYSNQKLQDLTDESTVPHMLYITSFFGGERGVVVFTYHNTGFKALHPLLTSIYEMNDSETTNAFVWLLFESLENIAIQPQWWDGLEQRQRQLLCELMVPALFKRERNSSFLSKGKDLMIPSWTVFRKTWVTDS